MKRPAHLQDSLRVLARCALLAPLAAGAAHAQTHIARDGTLGAGAAVITGSGTLLRNGTTYQRFSIPERFGRRVGGNVFHSFSDFSLGRGDAAVYSFTAPTRNVVSRVTGGTPSVLHGLLTIDATHSGGAPNFFFVNPAGITFGAGAVVDVPGAFHASTAGQVRFPDAVLYADPARNSTFSSADPAAFGFLAPLHGGVVVRDRAQVFTSGAALSLSGSSVLISGARVGSLGGGEVRIAATGASPAEVPLQGALRPLQGDVQILAGGSVRTLVDTAAAGDVVVAGGLVRIDSQGAEAFTGIRSVSDGATAGAAGNITISASRSVRLTGGGIGSETFSAANAGHVAVSAARVVVDGFAAPDASGEVPDTSIASRAQAGTGAAGSVTVTASGHVSLRNGGTLSATSFSAGDAGTVRLRAGSADIQGENERAYSGVYARSGTDGRSAPGRIEVRVPGRLALTAGGILSTATQSDADAGDVHVRAGELVLRGGSIATESLDSGGAGNIRVEAASIEMEGADAFAGFTSISSMAFHGGKAGAIDITATGAMSLSDGAQVISATSSSGDAGNVRVRAGSLRIDGVRDGLPTGLASSTFGSGNAGAMRVEVAGTLSVLRGGEISSMTAAGGNAGSVVVTARDIALDGRQMRVVTGINSAAAPESTGHGGDVVVTARNTLTMNNALIISDTFGPGNAGNVTTSAGSLRMANASFISSDTLGSGDAGTVRVTAPVHLQLLSDSTISSSTFGAGSAGAVTVRGGRIDIDAASVSATAATGSGGQVGTVTVAANERLQLTHGASISLLNEATVPGSASLLPASIQVVAPVLRLDDASITAASTGNVPAGSVDIRSSGALRLSSSTISTAANEGDGGAIAIRGGGLLDLTRSSVTTSVAGTRGDGGNIDVRVDNLLLRTGFIQANTAAGDASGGTVSIQAANVVPSGSFLIVGGSTSFVFDPDVFGFNLIQAAAPTGVSGRIDITSPALDLTGALAGFNVRPIDALRLAGSPCVSSGGSSFASRGRGALPLSGRTVLAPETAPAPQGRPQAVRPAAFAVSAIGCSASARVPAR